MIKMLQVLFVLSKAAGWLVGLVEVPPMVGMLLMGVLLKNTGYIDITGDYQRFTAILR